MSMAMYNLGLGMAPQSNVVQTTDEVMKAAQERAAALAAGYEDQKRQATQDYTNYLTQQAGSFYGDAIPQSYVQKMVETGLGGANKDGNLDNAPAFLRQANLGGAYFWNPESVVGKAPDTSWITQGAQKQADQMGQSHQIQQQAYDGILNGGGFSGGVLGADGAHTSIFGTPMAGGGGLLNGAWGSGAWGKDFGQNNQQSGWGSMGASQSGLGGPFSVKNPWSNS